MDAIILQILNGLDKGSAYALIALGLTLIFGTLGVVNFAHGALFMIGAFCAVTLQGLLNLSRIEIDETKTDFLGNPAKIEVPYLHDWFGVQTGQTIMDWSVPLAILFAIPIMMLIGIIMERGLIKHFYKRPHADQILVTFGLAIVLHYFAFALLVIGIVFAFLQFTTFGMVVRAGMADRETVGLLGINIDRRFTIMFAIAACVAGLAGVMYTPINSPNYHMGMDFLVLSFVVVVVGGMGSLGGAVLAGFLLGILESFASMSEVIAIFPGINQIIIYLVAIVILLTRPRGLMGRKGVMED